MIDLFDGKLKGTDPARVHFTESVEGEAVDYDFTLDVGLIRMRPGASLPASRVVPASWDLQSRMKVLTVGCSEGRDATAWHTVVRRPRIQNFLSGNPNYEAIECDIAPKEGRSGGGLIRLTATWRGSATLPSRREITAFMRLPARSTALLDRNRPGGPLCTGQPRSAHPGRRSRAGRTKSPPHGLGGGGTIAIAGSR